MGRASVNQEGCRMPVSIRSVNLRNCYTVPYHLPPSSKSSKGRGSGFTRSNGKPRPSEYQSPGTVRTRRPRSFWERRSVVGGGGGGRVETGCRFVLGELRWEVGGEPGSLGWNGSGEFFYGTDVIIGSLCRGGGQGHEWILRSRTGEGTL